MLQAAGHTLQGICDMAGNVQEWVEDCWFESYRGAPGNGAARLGCEDDAEPWRTRRNGGWSAEAFYLRSAARDGRPAIRNHLIGMGFCIAKSP